MEGLTIFRKKKSGQTPAGKPAASAYSNAKKENRIEKTPEKQGFSLSQKISRLRRIIRYRWYMLISLKGAAMSLALPIAFGIAFSFVPSFGLGAPVTFLFALLCRANKTAGVLASIAATPLTPFFYALDLVVAGFIGRGKIVVDDLATQSSEALEIVTRQKLFDPSSILAFGANFFIASFILFAIVYALVFPLIYYSIIAYQKKRLERKNTRLKKALNPAGPRAAA